MTVAGRGGVVAVGAAAVAVGAFVWAGHTGLATVAGMALCGALGFRWPLAGAALMLVALAFFPEYSQTDWGVRSAEDFRSLYNARPLPGVLASPFDLGFLALLVGWVGGLGRRVGSGHAPPSPLGGLALGALLTVAWGVGRGAARLGSDADLYHLLREMRPLVYAVLFFLLLYEVARRDERGWRRLWVVVVAVACVHGMEGVGRYLMGIGRTYHGARMVYFDVADSLVLASGLLLVVCRWLRSARPVAPRWGAAVLLAAPAAVSILLSYRRSVWAGLAVAALVLPLFVPRAARRRYLWIAGVAGVALVAVAVTRLDELALGAERLAALLEPRSDPSTHFRLFDVENGLHAVRQSAGLGVGFGGRGEVVASTWWLADFLRHVSRTNHNAYLYLAMKLGIPAAGWWLAGLWAALAACRRAALRGAVGWAPAGAGLLVVAAAVAALGLPLAYNVRPMLWTAAVAALGLAAGESSGSGAAPAGAEERP